MIAIGWFADVLLSERPNAARVAVATMLDAGRDPRSIYIEVLAPALVEVGLRWERGQVSVAQEHLATAVVSMIMDRLAPLLDEPRPVSRTILLAGTASDLHIVGLNMVEDFLVGDGWEVHNLGPATPPDGIASMANVTAADAVGLSTGLSTHLRDAAEAIARLRALPKVPFIIVGGNAYGGDPRIAESIGADAYGADARATSSILRERFPTGSDGVALRRDVHRRAAAMERHAADHRHQADSTMTRASLLPVCAWCGRVRNDHLADGEWQSVSAYLATVGIPVTHSMCRDCASSV